jgi:hypothetical protein
VRTEEVVYMLGSRLLVTVWAKDDFPVLLRNCYEIIVCKLCESEQNPLLQLNELGGKFCRALTHTHTHTHTHTGEPCIHNSLFAK